MTEEQRDLETEYLNVYGEHAQAIRTWFVAYGIGGPVLFITTDGLVQTLVDNGNAEIIGAFFLFAVAAQVVLSSLNKFSMWGLYYGEIKPRFKKKRFYKLAEWFSEALWIDFVVDMATMALLSLATWWTFSALMATKVGASG